MNARWILVLSMVACSDKKQDHPGDHEPASAAKPAPIAKCDADADFIHVDRDQLAAVCLEAQLPSTYWRPWAAALKTADGKRLPWLALQIDGRVGDGEPKDWITHARAKLKDLMSHLNSPPAAEGPRTGSHWYNVPCQDTETFTTVITIVAFDKNGAARVYAIRGDKMLDQDGPKSGEQATYRAAFELAQQLVGQPISIATHQLGGGGVLSTMDDEVWKKASSPSKP